jgi:hypothetical protein
MQDHRGNKTTDVAGTKANPVTLTEDFADNRSNPISVANSSSLDFFVHYRRAHADEDYTIPHPESHDPNEDLNLELLLEWTNDNPGDVTNGDATSAPSFTTLSLVASGVLDGEVIYRVHGEQSAWMSRIISEARRARTLRISVREYDLGGNITTITHGLAHVQLSQTFS